jgi:hypothetical protein
MSFVPENPLIVQSDHTILLEVHSPYAEAAREAIAPFAELVKSPEHVHTYRITPLSVWNARAAGLSVAAMVEALRRYAKYPIPESVAQEIETLGRRYGLTVIERSEQGLLLRVAERPLAELLARDQRVAPLLEERLSPLSFRIDSGHRGVLKQALVAAGYPAEDIAGYVEGEPLSLRLRTVSRAGQAFSLRPYQLNAAEAFYQAGRAQGGSGVIVLPCGAGKTLVGMAVMAALGYSLNILSLFGLVLAIGIVVDDAIIVVENVERLLREGQSPKEAARNSMREVSTALLAQGLVLIAVFIPTTCLEGITGQFFRQFAVTIATATAISVLVSLTLSPALAALIMRHDAARAAPRSRLRRWAGWPAPSPPPCSPSSECSQSKHWASGTE